MYSNSWCYKELVCSPEDQQQLHSILYKELNMRERDRQRMSVCGWRRVCLWEKKCKKEGVCERKSVWEIECAREILCERMSVWEKAIVWGMERGWKKERKKAMGGEPLPSSPAVRLAWWDCPGKWSPRPSAWTAGRPWWGRCPYGPCCKAAHRHIHKTYTLMEGSRLSF